MDEPERVESEDAQEPFTRRHSRLLVILIVGVIVIGVAWMERHRLSYKEGTAHPLVGTRLTQVRLEPLEESAPIITEEDFHGKVTLINFWGTWCPPCRLEMPHLIDLYKEFRGDSNFQMILVSCKGSPGQSAKKLREMTTEYLSQFDVRPSVAFDPEQVTRRRIAELGLSDFGYPTTIILDEDGVIRGLWVGYRNGLENLQRALLRDLLRQAQRNSKTPP